MSEQVPLTPLSEVTSLVLDRNGNHGEVIESFSPAAEWQTVDTIGFKGLVPTSKWDKIREAVGRPSKKQKYSFDEADYARGRASKNHSDYREQQKIAEENHALARTDALTGLGNRLALQELLDEEIQKDDAPGDLTLVFMDVDGFKSVNDTHGHAVGDDLLVSMANKFKDNTYRDGEGVFRLGGDEFVFVINTKDTGNSRRTPKEKEEQVELFLTRMKKGITDSGDELPHEVTVGGSFGVVNYRAGENTREFVERADIAMYDKKDQQKNDVIEAIGRLEDTSIVNLTARGSNTDALKPSGSQTEEYDGKEFMVGSTRKFSEFIYTALNDSQNQNRVKVESELVDSMAADGTPSETIHRLAGGVANGVDDLREYFPALTNRLLTIMDTQSELDAKLALLQATSQDTAAIERAQTNCSDWAETHAAEKKVVGHHMYMKTAAALDRHLDSFHRTFGDQED